MLPAFKKTYMLTPTPGERMTDRTVVVLLMFFAVMAGSSIAQSVLMVIPLCIIPAATHTEAVEMLIQLFATTAMVVAVILWCRLGERRSLVTLGFTKRGAIPEYLVGLVGGVALFGGAVLLCVLTDTAAITVTDETPSAWWLLLFFIGFLIQGMSEELLCRAFLMVSLSRRRPLWLCAVLNALVFSLLHIFNPGISVIALINIFLFGLFASVLTLRRGSIWMVGALHSMWNFAQGNLFGIPVSGLTGMPSPLTTTLSDTTAWHTLVNGGAFGLEGGLAVTAVLVVGLAIVVLLPTKRCEVAEG